MKHHMRRVYGFYVNEKKIYRICDENGLLLNRPEKMKRRSKRIATNREVTGPNQLWQFDIKVEWIHGEQRPFYILGFIDVYSKLVVSNYVGLTCKAKDLASCLVQGIRSQGIENATRLVIRSDNGPQMTSDLFAEKIASISDRIEHEFIPIRTPNKNAFIESFFSILELELISVSIFENFAHAYEKIKKFIHHYNEVRIHSAIGYITPSEALNNYKRGDLNQQKTLTM